MSVEEFKSRAPYALLRILNHVLADGSFDSELVMLGVIDALMQALEGDSEDTQEEAMYCLSNLCASSVEI